MAIPDVLVSCDPHDNNPRTVHPAVLIFEGLSNSTEARNRGWKFEHYQLMRSLQQYVLAEIYERSTIPPLRLAN